jgi:predicted metalloprotease with PDZ domain
MQIHYTVRADGMTDHRARCTVDLEGTTGDAVDLVVPSWVPGSYYIRNYSRGFRDFVARSEPDGRPLDVRPVDKARWRVATGGADHVRVDYTVYGHDLITEGFDLTHEHMFVNAALCLPFVDGELGTSVTLTVEIPSDWKVVTELEEVGPRTYRARTYDELVDSPLDAGVPVVLTIRPSGIPHRISLCGEGGNYDARRLEQDVSKVVGASVALLGDSPLSAYTFFVHLTDVRDGGLEHSASTSCVVDRTCFQPEPSYQRFLSLIAHEYLHLYNVKRIRPKVLGPFDYTQEAYTRQLWWMEGTTDYFTYLVLRRSGLYTIDQFLKQRARTIREYVTTPGRNRISLEDSSLLAWVDYYQPFEETPNQSVSYYTKGDLVSMCLDLEIRHRSETRASLEDVLRTLWNEYGKPGVGLGEDELLPVVNRSTGLDLTSFFDRFVRGTDDLDIASFARLAGLDLAPAPKPPEEKDSPEPGDLGVAVEDSGGLPRVRRSFAGRPAYSAGLTPGDEIVAIDGLRVTFSNLEKTLERYPPGTTAEITVFRRGYLHTVRLVTGVKPPEKYVLAPAASPTELAQRVYEAWVGEKWAPRAVGS